MSCLVQAAGGVAQHHRAEVLAPVDEDRREEAGHRAAVPDQRAVAEAHDLQPEAVRRPAGGRGVDARGRGHLLERVGAQHVGGVTEQERREARRGRSSVDHSWPAAAIAPASSSGSGSSTSAHGWTAQPCAAGAVRARRRAGHAERQQHLVAHDVRPGPAAGRAPAARRAPRSRGWSSGTAGPRRAARPRCEPRRQAGPVGSPGVRSHHRPGLSARSPAVCESSWPTVRCPNGVPGTCARAGRRGDSRPSSRSRRTATAVTVLLIEPRRYCTSVCGSSTAPRPADQASPPSRTTPAVSDGTRLVRCARAVRASSRRAVGSSSGVVMGGHRTGASSHALTAARRP